MANFTKQAIKFSFLKLLNEQPLNKITVRDIVEDCGINRNSFYYHYQDIPTLIEEIIMELFDRLLKKYPNITSLSDVFKTVVEFSLKNKRALLHIYNSVKRDVFEDYLLKYCEYVVTAYIDTVYKEKLISDKDRKIVLRFVKCQLFGSSLDWLNSGMQMEQAEELQRMLLLCKDLPDEIIKSSGEIN